MAKMITCKHCGAEFAANEKFCPHCGGKNKKPIFEKGWFWGLIVIILLVVAGNGRGNKSSDDSKKVSGYTEASESTVPKSSKKSSQTKTETPVPVIEKTVIYEGNDVTITATGIKKSGDGWDINLFIENNSTLNLGFNAHAFAINGIMTRNNIYSMDCDVAAGKKTNVALKLKGSVLKKYGITEVRCVDVLFWAYDNDKSFKAFDTDQIEIRTSLYNETHDLIQGKNIYDSDGIKVDFLGNEGSKYNFVITNNTGSYFNFDFDEISINDFTVSGKDYDLFDELVLNNCQIVVTVTVRDDFKSANGIVNVETIEWNLSMRPYGSFSNKVKIGPIVYIVE